MAAEQALDPEYLGTKGVLEVNGCRYLFEKCKTSNVPTPETGRKYHMKCETTSLNPRICDKKAARFMQLIPGGTAVATSPPVAREECSAGSITCRGGEQQLRAGFKCSQAACVQASDAQWCCKRNEEESVGSFAFADFAEESVGSAATFAVAESAEESSSHWQLLTAVAILGGFVGLYAQSYTHPKGDSLEEHFISEETE